MNGVTPDPSDPIRDGDALSRLKLAQALDRAIYAIAWERAWPHLARVLTVVGLFLVVSWAGLWLALPSVIRAIGLVAFAGIAIAALVPLLRFRWPSRDEALSRLDRGSGIRHRPATTLTDTLSSKDPVALALWQAQRERTLASLKRIRAGLPHPRLALHDPWALRALVMVMLVATFFAAGDERAMRLGAAFDWNGVLAPTNVRVDAWITPPLYTGKPPVILSAANKEAAALPASGPLAVPAGSTLIVRSSGSSLDVVTSGGLKEVAPTEAAPKGTNEKHFTITGDGTAHVRAPSGQPQWAFAATPDRAPTIALAKDPERQAYGALQLSYKIEDDYGVTGAAAQFVPRATEDKDGTKDADGKAARPLFQPPQFALTLPNARTRNGVGQTVKDLSEDPYSGADVTLTLTAKDEAGNEAKSEPFNMRLPGRLFTKPLARALIEQRRILALDANKNSDVYAALDALMIAPEMFTPEAGQYLGLHSVARQLEAARTDDSLREVVASLWALAVTIEDGNISDVAKALRAAQDALKQALQRGASDEELKKLMDNLRTALDNYMRQYAQQMRSNPLARPAIGLDDQMKRIERLIQRGNREAAARELDRLARALENPPGPPSAEQKEMDEIARELNDLLREQNALRDETDRQSKDSKRGQRTKPLPPKVAEILRKSRELRQKTRGATSDQLEDLARQQDALREELRTWRESQGAR
ncbi:TIGR02302 family protein [Bradyrhizobium sp. 61]|uniref:TIGR02302 family protein n=1 Tax=unclassified Bradyrhizobium TaxID=2631580 RepID=UPI001FFA5B3E|nr:MULTISPECIES: TIGR02302 family protein [unclassified Bradyrhizobium]MCK1279146.1 TIGR02302 family protein [Bradyrhizobium sp. 61]MCK1447118.1 TIGR02302 family protein [Bradyrhizobium sp. 48]MCK1464282.1 TIGR02302 family protein [Bradyrhizobium sp. 2]